MSNELKRCPFCDGPGFYKEYAPSQRAPRHAAGCVKCSYEVWPADTKEEVCTRWNTRAPAPVPTSGAVEAELRKALEHVDRNISHYIDPQIHITPRIRKNMLTTVLTVVKVALSAPNIKLETHSTQPPAADGKLEALVEVKEILDLIDADGERAKYFNGSARTAGEDAAVLALCDAYGFGAVMDSAARQWYAKDPSGAFVIGSCAGLVRSLKAKVAEALAQPASGGGE